MIGTYTIRHNTGVYYIGQTRNLGNRKRGHKHLLEAGKHPATKLQEAYNTDPRIEWDIIPTTDVAEAMALEEYYLTINKGDPNLANKFGNGFTTELVKSCTGGKQSEETIRKRVEKTRGLKRSDECRQKSSDASRDSELVKANMDKLHEAAKRPVVVDGVIYASVKDTALAHGIHPATVIQRINSNSDRFMSWTY